MKSLYLFVVWAYCVQQVLCLAKPRIVCPLYVPENKSTTCWCENPREGQGQVRLWWPLRSNTSQLLLKNVQREDNGTQSNCSMTIDGQTTSSVYTLRVAYGPSSEHLHVSPLQFVSCGPQTFSVTCNAMETYPTPAYNWYGIACENTAPDNICTFTLDPKSNYFKLVTCNATGQPGTTQKLKASKTFRLDFYCPPLHKPVIQPTHTNHVLRPGDNVTCTVTGGRPPVESVHFYCVNPFLADEDDERNETSVSSSVTVNSSLVSVKNMECYCNATWKEGPEYYQYVSTAVYNVTPRNDYGSGMVAGVSVLLFDATVIVVIIIIIIIRKRLRDRHGLGKISMTVNPRNGERTDAANTSDRSDTIEDEHFDLYVDVEREFSPQQQRQQPQRQPPQLQRPEPYAPSIITVHASGTPDSTEDSEDGQYIDVDNQLHTKQELGALREHVQGRPLPLVPSTPPRSTPQRQQALVSVDSTEDCSSVYVDVDELSNNQSRRQARSQEHTERSQFPEAGISLTCLGQRGPKESDSSKLEESDLCVSGATSAPRNEYDRTQQLSNAEHYMYTDFKPTSSNRAAFMNSATSAPRNEYDRTQQLSNAEHYMYTDFKPTSSNRVDELMSSATSAPENENEQTIQASNADHCMTMDHNAPLSDSHSLGDLQEKEY